MFSQRPDRRTPRLILAGATALTATAAVTGIVTGNAQAAGTAEAARKCTLPFEIPASQGGFTVTACAVTANGVPKYTLRITNRTPLPRPIGINVEDSGLEIQYNVRTLRAGASLETPPIGLSTRNALVEIDAQSASAYTGYPWASVGTDVAGPTLPKVARCDRWYWKSQAKPKKTRREIGWWTLDNTGGQKDWTVTETIERETTSSFTNSAEISAGVSVGFSAFSAELKASYGITTTEEMRVKKGETVQFTVPAGKKATLHAGIQEVTAKGYYYRLSDCDGSPKLEYYLNVQERAPLPGKVTWMT